jgi:hypothetical protein
MRIEESSSSLVTASPVTVAIEKLDISFAFAVCYSLT